MKVAPGVIFPNASVANGNLIIPLTSIGVSSADADPSTGNAAALLLALARTVYNNYQLVQTASRSSRYSTSLASGTVSGSPNVTSLTFSQTFQVDNSAASIAAES